MSGICAWKITANNYTAKEIAEEHQNSYNCYVCYGTNKECEKYVNYEDILRRQFEMYLESD